jgi:hypothetical protein
MVDPKTKQGRDLATDIYAALVPAAQLDMRKRACAEIRRAANLIDARDETGKSMVKMLDLVYLAVESLTTK